MAWDRLDARPARMRWPVFVVGSRQLPSA